MRKFVTSVVNFSWQGIPHCTRSLHLLIIRLPVHPNQIPGIYSLPEILSLVTCQWPRGCFWSNSWECQSFIFAPGIRNRTGLWLINHAPDLRYSRVTQGPPGRRNTHWNPLNRINPEFSSFFHTPRSLFLSSSPRWPIPSCNFLLCKHKILCRFNSFNIVNWRSAFSSRVTLDRERVNFRREKSY